MSSETPADPKAPKKDPIQPPPSDAGIVQPTSTPSSSEDININIVDDTTDKVDIEEFNKMKKEFAELKAGRQAADKKKYLEELKQINPKLAEKYKDESADALKDRLETAIETAELLKPTKTPPSHVPAGEAPPEITTAGYVDNDTGKWTNYT